MGFLLSISLDLLFSALTVQASSSQIPQPGLKRVNQNASADKRQHRETNGCTNEGNIGKLSAFGLPPRITHYINLVILYF